MISLRDQNQVLFFALIAAHFKEILPIIYTPVVGEAIQRFSHIFRRPDGLFLSYPNRDRMERDLSSWGGRTDIDLVVVTDSEGILGIGWHLAD